MAAFHTVIKSFRVSKDISCFPKEISGVLKDISCFPKELVVSRKTYCVSRRKLFVSRKTFCVCEEIQCSPKELFWHFKMESQTIYITSLTALNCTSHSIIMADKQTLRFSGRLLAINFPKNVKKPGKILTNKHFTDSWKSVPGYLWKIVRNHCK